MTINQARPLIEGSQVAAKHSAPALVAGLALLFFCGGTHAAGLRVLNPQDMNQAFADAYNSRDIEQVMGLYTAEAQLVNADNSVAKGLREIRKAQSELLKIGGKLTATNLSTVIVGDIALLNASWQIATLGQDGKPLTLSGFTSEAVKRQADGTWLYLIDNPFPPK